MQQFVNQSKQKAAKEGKQTGLFGMAPRQVQKQAEEQEIQDQLPGGMDDDEMDVELFKKVKTMPKFIPWVEKYRPSKIDEVSHQQEVVSALNTAVKSGHVPHLLMYGPPGTGKTSCVLAMAKELFGKDHYKQRILELNASDERGIKVVRDKIKKFAQKKIQKNLKDGDRVVPPIQLIILDEADSMTVDAQSALRRIIEEYSKVTRFCIICNYIAKIIDPLASRCVKFRFSLINQESQLNRLQKICQAEEISVENDQVLQDLIEISEGDLRRSINTLQTCSSFVRGNPEKNIPNGTLTQSDIERVSGVVPDSVIAETYNQLKQVRDYNGVQQITQDLILEGYDVQQLIVRLMDHFIQQPVDQVTDIQKAKISECIAEADFKMIQGADEELNLLDILSQISLIINN